MKKYYFISYSETRRGTSTPRSYFLNDLIDIHPLQWQIENREKDHTKNAPGDFYNCELLYWVEITEDEYKLYNEKFSEY